MTSGVSQTILLTGATGYLGHALIETIRSSGEHRVVTLGRSRADIALDLDNPNEPASLEALTDLLDREPNCRLIHAAALSSIAACKRAPELADRINHQSTRTLATLAGSRLILVSTDLVFGGAGAPFTVDDATRPVSEYGLSKARGEAEALHQSAIVARLPLLFGRSFDGKRGASDMLRSARAKVTLYDNEFRTPLHVADAAQLLLELASSEESGGVHHLTWGERLSRLELGQRLLQSCPDMPELELVPTPSRARDRPRDVSMTPTLQPRRTLAAALASC